MKSTHDQLKQRGFIEEIPPNILDINNNELIMLLTDKEAVNRSIAAKIIGKRKNRELLPWLCQALAKERKLYTKIAICETIESFGGYALEFLIPLLGAIGNNQHKKVQLVDINKKSYPLPRDISARIICRIGIEALPLLEGVLKSGSYEQKLEAIDAIGHITFNFCNYRSEGKLFELLNDSFCGELIRWKIIRAFQSFQSNKIIRYLERLVRENNDEILAKEAQRSLDRIKARSIKYTQINKILKNITV